MSAGHPLTVTVEQAAEVLGIGRSTAYELVRSGDLPCLRLRRRFVVPVAQLADKLGVSARDVEQALVLSKLAHAAYGVPSMEDEPGDVVRATEGSPTLF